jgi:tyrosine aminotransferase
MYRVIPKSIVASRTMNPIRRIVDMMKIEPNPSKKLIPLTIGDPTIHGNYLAPDHIVPRIQASLKSHAFNGYPHACGIKEAREAVARTHSVNGLPVSYEDVILTCGCSQAIEMCISVLANPGEHNILLPRPGFSLYQTLCNSKGIESRFYSLDPKRRWECDLKEMESQIDENTCAILINNPSNPCGSNFTRSHIEDIIKVAERFNLPIIADEIYEKMVFGGATYTSFAEVLSNVPILHVGGLAKQYMIPGWRLGWIVLHDRRGQLSDVKKGLMDLSTLTLGPSSVIQSIVGDLLEMTDSQYYSSILKQLEDSVRVIHDNLSDVKGLHVIEPQGAMYVMIGIDTDVLNVKDDVEFSQRLVKEESVFVLPGQVFQMPNYFRVVITSPRDVMEDACSRIRSFCERIVR